MSEPQSGARPQEVYRALQPQARKEGRGTQELFEFYLLERFLYRLSISEYRDHFVLKGGLLLTAVGVRRPTRDVDVLARNIRGDEGSLLSVAKEVAAISVEEPLFRRLVRADYHDPGARGLPWDENRHSGYSQHGAIEVAFGYKHWGPRPPSTDNVPHRAF